MHPEDYEINRNHENYYHNKEFRETNIISCVALIKKILRRYGGRKTRQSVEVS